MEVLCIGVAGVDELCDVGKGGYVVLYTTNKNKPLASDPYCIGSFFKQ